MQYAALKGFNETVISVGVMVDRESAQMKCGARVPPLKLEGRFEDVVSLFDAGLPDGVDDHEFEYEPDDPEDASIFLTLTAGSFEYLPDIADVSRTFKRLKKFLEKHQSRAYGRIGKMPSLEVPSPGAC